MPPFKSTWKSSPPTHHSKVDESKPNRAAELKEIMKMLGYKSLSPMQSYMHKAFTQKHLSVEEELERLRRLEIQAAREAKRPPILITPDHYDSTIAEPQWHQFLLLMVRRGGKTEGVVQPIVLDRAMNFQKQTILWSAQSAQDVITLFRTNIVPRLRESGLFEELEMEAKLSFPDAHLYVGKTDSSIIIMSNSDNAGRGLKVNLLVMDELRALLNTERDEALIPATLDQLDGQVLMTSTAGNHKSEMLRRKREAGILSVTRQTRMGFAEWSADPEDDFFSDKTLKKTNPSIGYTVTLDKLKASRDIEALTGDLRGWAAEHLNVWKESSHESVIPSDLFNAVETGQMSIADLGNNPVVAFDIEDDHIRDYISVAIAGNGNVALQATNLPVEKFYAFLRALHEQHPQFRTVIVKKQSRLEEKLINFKPGYPVDRKFYMKASRATACNRLLDDIIEKKIRIKTSGGALWPCLQAVVKKPHQDLFVWDKEVRDVNIAPLWAVTMAHNEACWKAGRGVPRVRVFKYGGGEAR